MVDIGPEKEREARLPVEASIRTTNSILRARELFERELLRGVYPSLRCAEQPAPTPENATDSPEESSPDVEAARGLFFVVEPRFDRRPGELQASGSPPGLDNSIVFSPSTGVPLPYPWIEGGARREEKRRGHGSSAGVELGVPKDLPGEGGGDRGGDDGDSGSTSDNRAGGGENLGNRRIRGARGKGDGKGEDDGEDEDDSDGNGDGVGLSDGDGGEDDFTVPYWAILRVGEVTSAPGEDAQPWPLLAGGGRSGVPTPVVQQKSPPKPTAGKVEMPKGYSIVVVNVKVSIHHPEGSAVAANKDAVVEGLTTVSEILRL